jgi:hypothetical protein
MQAVAPQQHPAAFGSVGRREIVATVWQNGVTHARLTLRVARYCRCLRLVRSLDELDVADARQRLARARRADDQRRDEQAAENTSTYY